MITLAFDTATPAPSLALLRGDEPIAQRRLEADRGAGRRVTEEIHLLLVDAGVGIRDVGRIVVGIGPGGFTGLRIGIATALALGQATRAEVTGVSTLESLALGIAPHVPAGALLLPVIDARRNEVFTGAYRAGRGVGLEIVAPPRAATVAGVATLLDEIASDADPAWAAGDGVARIGELEGGALRLLDRASPAHAVDATLLARRADTGGAGPVVANYLRLPDAEVNRLRRAEEAATA